MAASVSPPAARAAPASPAPPEPERFGRATWWLIAAVTAIATGVTAAAMPIALIALTGLAAGAWSFLRLPWLVMGGFLVTRASLDATIPLFILGGVTLPGLAGAGVAFGGGLALLLSRQRALPVRWLTYPFLAFLLFALVSLAYSRNAVLGLQTWMPLLAMFVLFCWAAKMTRSELDLRRMAWWTMLASFVPGMVALWQWVTGNAPVTKDGSYAAVSGTFSHPNGMAFFALAVIAFGVVLYRQPISLLRKAVVLSAISLSSLCLFLTYARSAWIALLAILLIMGLLHFRGMLVAAAVGAALALLAAPVAVSAIQERFSDLSGTGSDQSSWAWRVHNWSSMSMYADDHPVRGYGFGSFPALTWERFGSFERNFSDIRGPEDGIFAHNDYLNLLVELGLPGVLLWTWVLFALTFIAWRARKLPDARPYAAACVAIMVSLIVLSAVDNVQAYAASTIYPVMMVAGLAGLCARRPRPPSS